LRHASAPSGRPDESIPPIGAGNQLRIVGFGTGVAQLADRDVFGEVAAERHALDCEGGVGSNLPVVHRTRFWSGLAAFLVSMTALACARAPELSGSGSVVTLADYFALGESRVQDALVRAPNSSDRVHAALAEDCARAVVRLRIHFDAHEGVFSISNATAALVDGGRRAITVAHAAVFAFEKADARIELVLGDGRALAAKARPLDHYDPRDPTTDWAVLDVIDPPADLVALELGVAEAGERVVLGFPGRFGLDERGRPLPDDGGQRLRLSPLRVLCRASEPSSTSLQLLAGAVPIGGISGAPCIDARGRIVAVVRAVTDRIENSATSWTVDVVLVDAFREALAR
jgi:hypothetical protein